MLLFWDSLCGSLLGFVDAFGFCGTVRVMGVLVNVCPEQGVSCGS